MADEKAVSIAVQEIVPEQSQVEQARAIARPQGVISRTLFQGWLLEVVSFVAALASFASLIAILATLHHMNVTKLPFKIKLTTAMSITAKVTEATLGLIIAACLSQVMWMRYSSRPRPLHDFALYDAATRGAKGQALFLLERRQSWKGYVGVALGLLLLAVGPFYQQSLGFRSLDGHSSLARCVGTNYSQSSGAMYNAFHEAMFTDMSQVSTNRDALLQTLNNDCVTGNCTYPTFASVGLCSACQNVTDQVKTYCSTENDMKEGNTTGCMSSITSGGGLFIKNWTDPEFGSVRIAMGQNNDSVLGDTYGNTVAYDWTTLRYSEGWQVHAASCVMYYCVRAYNSTVSMTSLSENVTTTWYDPDAKSVLGPWFEDPGGNHDMVQGNDTLLTPPQSLWGQFGLNQSVDFRIDSYTQTRVGQILEDSFSGTYYLNFTVDPKTQEVSEYGYFATTSDDFIVGQTYNNLNSAKDQDMQTMMGALATYMTNGIRNTCNNTDFAQGVTKNIQVVVVPGWLWLIFPGVLILATGGFLVATMFETKRGGFILWKTGILPLLMHGLNLSGEGVSGSADVSVEEVQPRDVAELEDLDIMKKHAQGIRVRLERHESGSWHFVKPEAA